MNTYKKNQKKNRLTAENREWTRINTGRTCRNPIKPSGYYKKPKAYLHVGNVGSVENSQRNPRLMIVIGCGQETGNVMHKYKEMRDCIKYKKYQENDGQTAENRAWTRINANNEEK